MINSKNKQKSKIQSSNSEKKNLYFESNNIYFNCMGALILACMLVISSCDLFSEADAAPQLPQDPDFNKFGFAVSALGAGVKADKIYVQTPLDRRVKVVQAKIYLEKGGGHVPWHTHPGPVIGVVTGGGTLTIVSEDCSVQTYPTGTTFRAPINMIHTARNNSADSVTVVATFVIPENDTGTFEKPTTLELKEVREQLDAKCNL